MKFLLIGLALASLAGCTRKPAARSNAAGEKARPAATAAADAAPLAREMFDLIDRALSYKSAHRGRLPRSLRELGVDELTSTTARKYTIKGNQPEVTISYRKTAGHLVSSCSGTSLILEEATLQGDFPMSCTLVAGDTATIRGTR
ncbi:MAG: hypothetical protein AB7I33_07950 [Gemmatimonadales bacterium]